MTTNNTTTVNVVTIESATKAINEAVNAYNAETDTLKFNAIGATFKDLCEKFNKASELAAYATCLEDSQPILALAKIYKCKTKSVKVSVDTTVDKDGHVTMTHNAEVKDGAKVMDMFAFIDWAENQNHTPITASSDWKNAVINARLEIEKAWKSFFTDDKKSKDPDKKFISVGQMKRLLQAALDKIVFVPREGNSEENVLRITSEMARIIFAFCNKFEQPRKADDFTSVYHICDTKAFNALFFDMVKNNVHKNAWRIVYDCETSETATK